MEFLFLSISYNNKLYFQQLFDIYMHIYDSWWSSSASQLNMFT